MYCGTFFHAGASPVVTSWVMNWPNVVLPLPTHVPGPIAALNDAGSQSSVISISLGGFGKNCAHAVPPSASKTAKPTTRPTKRR